MKTIVLKYDERSSLAQKTIDYILSLGVFKVEEKTTAIDASLKEARAGKINSYDSVSDFFEKTLRDV